VPVFFRNWEIHLEFRVSGKGKDLFGDGMAFWYVRNPLSTGPVFGNEELFSGLGVFLDTYANQNGAHSHGHPYISAMVNNGSTRYDHDRDGTHSELAGCESKFRGSDHPTYFSVRYEGDVLTVSTDIAGKNEWTECFKVAGVQLPTGYYFGVSAATGDLSDNHDVISFRTYELEVSDADLKQGDRSHIVPHAAVQSPDRPHVHDAPAGSSVLRVFFIVIISVFGIIAVVAVGYYFYQQKGAKKNRFY
jgi:mannose-binding lectin 2